MIEIPLAFNPEATRDYPNDHEREDAEKFLRIFKHGGIPLRFWALWKSKWITNQYFLPLVIFLVEQFEESRELKRQFPYQDIDGLEDLLWRSGILENACMTGVFTSPGRAFIIEFWDYFNPHIQKRLRFTHGDKEWIV